MTAPNLPPLPKPEGHIYDGPNGAIGFHRGDLDRWTGLIHSTMPVFTDAQAREIQQAAYQSGFDAAIKEVKARIEALENKDKS